MKIGLVILAAGVSRRFNGNKLLENINGRRLFEITIDKFNNFHFYKKAIVSCNNEIKKYVEDKKYIYIENDKQELGQSYSIMLGVKLMYDCDALMFSVCDQPNLSTKTIKTMLDLYKDNEKILAVKVGDRLGNPNIFGKRYYDDLLKLNGDVGGKVVINKNLSNTKFIEVDEKELFDIDTRYDLDILIKK